MGNFINKIVENNILFASVLFILIVILIVLVVLIIRSLRDNRKINVYEENLEDEDFKKVKNVKKEDIIETPDKEIENNSFNMDSSENEKYNKRSEFDSDELEQRYFEEKQKEIETAKKEEHNLEFERIISKIEEDSKLKPEEVVANFEKEQEAQSIISYKELVNAVKNRDDDYKDELEFRPLDTVSNIMDDLEFNKNEEVSSDSIKKVESDDRKFRNTDVISPVYGIVNSYNDSDKKIDNLNSEKYEIDDQKTIDLSSTDLSDFDFMLNNDEQQSNMKDSVTALDEIYRQMSNDLKTDTSNTDNKLKSTNEEFLQSLKDFRNKL